MSTKMPHAIVDTGATTIFIMEGTPVENKRIATKPLTINLPYGTKIKSTHCCDITIPGLPTILTGNIVLGLSIASLIGVRVLCEAGCTVTFCKDRCDVIYNVKTILKGCKDPSTELWTIPINASHMPPLHTMEPTRPDTVQHTAHFAYSISTFNASKQGQIRTPISVQSQDIHAPQSKAKRFPKRVPKHL